MNTVSRIDYQLEDFKVIQSIMHKHAGISLHDGKQELVYSRLAKRVRTLGYESFREYCDTLDSNDEEVLFCINSMTTNVTSFFREQHHFEFLEQTILQDAANSSLRIWSAGCSSGEEPYSVAFTCGERPDVHTEIIATDLDSEVLRRARNGIYKMKDVVGMSDSQRRKWFLRGKGAHEGKVRIRDQYRHSIEFYQLNLRNDWNHREPFDVIFCRNVMIYFDKDFRERLVRMFCENLRPGGYLVLGHSESLFGLNEMFKIAGKTIHQKVTETPASFAGLGRGSTR